MLSRLHLQNLAVVSDASVAFRPGLNVLTGETGAGKSIVVDCLTLLAGGRASAELIRTGAESLTVTGSFEEVPEDVHARLTEVGVASAVDEDLVVRREITRSGRNRVYLNDQPVTLRLLAELAPALLRIHGQREELGLAETSLQRTWVDRQGGAEGARLRERVAAAYEAYREIAERLAHAGGDERRRSERIDLLRYQVSEIDAAAVRVGEHEELEQERELLRHAEQVTAALSGLSDRLLEEDGSVAETLARLAAALREVQEWEPDARAWREEIEELRIRSQELARTVAARLDRIDADPTRLATIEERLVVLDRLLRKYGPGDAELLAHRDRAALELAELEADLTSVDALEAQAREALETYQRAAVELSTARAAWGHALAERVRAELAELALPDCRLEIRLDRRRRAESPFEVDGEAVDFGAGGFDQITFFFSPNPGEEPRPLAQVASGGELSRLYLALQLLVGGEDPQGRPTMVFDEVDSGVGGVEAVVLGRKLHELARKGQILSVTHLPQVASQGDWQFEVRKTVRGGRTHVAVELLEGPARVAEIARMLGGQEAAATALTHAERMLAEAGA